jgi:hypothetical protein
VISCGSSVGGGSAGDVTVNLGYEPQWVLLKNITTTNAALGPWILIDNMRGYFAPTTGENYLRANASNAEATGGFWTGHPTATGFTHYANAGESYIYIAIRRGPMKTPTTGTSVFSPVTQTAAGTVTTGFPVDLAISGSRTITGSKLSLDRLRGSSTNSYASLFTNSMAAEGTGTGSGFGFDNNTGYVDAFWSASSMAYWNFRRAPGFFDEICYTGDGASLSHNLGVTPELIIAKARGTTGSWRVTSSATTGVLSLEETEAKNGTDSFQTLTPCTATTMNLSGISQNTTNVAYLFASAPGVSKVGSYTGTGATQVINCGFAAGARFVLVKATSTTGNWLVYDTARGMIPSNDPYLALNRTAAEVTNTDWVDTAASGFELSNAGGNLANSNGVSYIFLAIA